MMRIMLLALLGACAPAAACEGLAVDRAWVREAPPGATVMAAYGRLENRGPHALAISAASSEDFGAAELHRTFVEGGIARMVRNPSLELAPAAAAALEPGGLHIMLFRPARALTAGEQVNITLHCGDRKKSFPFTITAEGP